MIPIFFLHLSNFYYVILRVWHFLVAFIVPSFYVYLNIERRSRNMVNARFRTHHMLQGARWLIKLYHLFLRLLAFQHAACAWPCVMFSFRKRLLKFKRRLEQGHFAHSYSFTVLITSHDGGIHAYSEWKCFIVCYSLLLFLV